MPVPAQREWKGSWEGFCVADMYDVMYGGLPSNEIVFWEREVELTAFRVSSGKVEGVEEGKV